MRCTVVRGMPGPLSATVIWARSVSGSADQPTQRQGATPTISAASMALSASSLRTTAANRCCDWPVMVCNSRTVKYSAARLISKVVRRRAGGITAAFLLMLRLAPQAERARAIRLTVTALAGDDGAPGVMLHRQVVIPHLP